MVSTSAPASCTATNSASRARSTSVLCYNGDMPLVIKPHEGTIEKRVGCRMDNAFKPEGDHAIDNVTVFAQVNNLRDLIGNDYWIPMIRFLQELYLRCSSRTVSRSGTRTRRSTRLSSHSRRRRRACNWVDLFEVFEPDRGAQGENMKDIYNSLSRRGFSEMTEQQFFNPASRA